MDSSNINLSDYGILNNNYNNNNNLNDIKNSNFYNNLSSFSGQDCNNSENILNQVENKPIIYKCDKCPFSILINFFEKNSNVYIYYNCQNNTYYHHEESIKDLYNFIQNNYNTNKLTFKCCKFYKNECNNNNNSYLFYCYICDKIYCEYHKGLHTEQKGHLLIDVNQINIKCVLHNKNLVKYNIQKKTNNCLDCCVNDDLNFKNLSDLYDIIDISEYENKIEEKKNLLTKIKKYCEEIEDNVSKILNEFKNNYEKFFSINNNLMKLVNDLILNYKKLKQENHLTYESIKNILNLANFKQIEFNFGENMNVFEKINDFNEFSKKYNFCIFKSSFDSNYINQFFNNNNIDVISNSFNDENILLNYEIRKIDAHKNRISSLLILQDKRLCSVSDDKTIKIFNPKKNFLNEITMCLHNNIIYGIIQIKDGRLLSFSSGRICLIELIGEKNYKCIQTINETNICYNSNLIELLDNRIATSLKNNILILKFDKKNKMLVRDYIIETDFIIYLGFLYQIKNDEILVSSYYDKNWGIKIYNLISNELKNNVKIRCIGRNNSICKINDNFIGICAEINSIKIFNIFNYCIDSEFFGNSTFFSLVKNKNYFLAGNYNSILLLQFINNKFIQISELTISYFDSLKINSIVCFDDDNICLSSNKNKLILLYLKK